MSDYINNPTKEEIDIVHSIIISPFCIDAINNMIHNNDRSKLIDLFTHPNTGELIDLLIKYL